MTPHIDKRMAPAYGALGSVAGVLLILYARGVSDWPSLLAWTFYGLVAASLLLGIASLFVAVLSKSLPRPKRALAYSAFLIPIAFVVWLAWAIYTLAEYAN